MSGGSICAAWQMAPQFASGFELPVRRPPPPLVAPAPVELPVPVRWPLELAAPVALAGQFGLGRETTATKCDGDGDYEKSRG